MQDFPSQAIISAAVLGRLPDLGGRLGTGQSARLVADIAHDFATDLGAEVDAARLELLARQTSGTLVDRVRRVLVKVLP